MRASVSWILVLAVYLAFPRFQRDRLEVMGFGEVLRMEWMRADALLTQAPRSRWDAEATAFVLPLGHMIPNLEDVSRITGLRVHGRLVSGYTYPCYRELVHRLLDLTVGQRSSLLSRVELQESLGLFHTGRGVAESVDEQLQRLTEGCSERLSSLGLPTPPWLEEGDFGVTEPRAHSLTLGAVVWQPYLGEADEGQPWLELARPYFGRVGWIHALNLVLPLHHYLTQRSLGLRQSVVEFSCRDRTPRPGQRFWGLHDTTDSREQIDDWECCGRQVRSKAVSDDTYLQAFALKYGAKVYRGARRQVDVAGEIASLWVLLHSAVQDREVAQREADQLRAELDRVRRAQAGASSSRVAESSQSDLEDRLADAVAKLRTTTDRATRLQEEVDRVAAERDQLCTQTDEMADELARLRTQEPAVDQAELDRLRSELLAQQTLAMGLQDVMMAISWSRSRSRSGREWC
ncbi:hypothetical protein Taro_004306 [Colocasia esculenta]|uniref:Uncharacterized protein n=1 Tax=Colocasia esculenta TaxID=4460 RepID=A0A843TUE3_COLES|nr:hypothetical protein [Colocasia esculenta]